MVNLDYLYNKEYAIKKAGEKSFYESPLVEKELSYSVIENGHILPFIDFNGGVADSNGEYVENTGLHNYLGNGYKFDKESAKIENETVIYIGALHNVWGHNITDCISRFWFLFSKEYKEKFNGLKIVFSPYPTFRFSFNFKQFLELMGVDYTNLVSVNEITKFDKIIVPERCFFNDENGRRYFTKEYKQLIDRVSNAIEPSNEDKYEKIYLTCTHFSKKQVGEEKLEKYFKSKGYTVIAPEEFTFKEQLAIYKRCKSFVTTDGSATHNSLFLNDGTEVLTIPRACFYTEYQLAINYVKDLNIFYIDSTLSILIPKEEFRWVGPFYYFVSENLLKYFGEEKKGKRFWKKQLKDFKQYYLMVRSKYDYNQRFAPDFYKEKAKYYLDKAKIVKMPSHFVVLRNYFFAALRKIKIKFRKRFLRKKG